MINTTVKRAHDDETAGGVITRENEKQIIEALQNLPEPSRGATNWELEELTGMPIQTLSTTRSYLERKGHLIWRDEVRKASFGKPQRVVVLKEFASAHDLVFHNQKRKERLNAKHKRWIAELQHYGYRIQLPNLRRPERNNTNTSS